MDVAEMEYPSPGARSVLHMSGGSTIVCYDLSDDDYRDAFGRYVSGSGYRVLDLRGYVVHGEQRFAAVFQSDHARVGGWSSHVVFQSDIDTQFATLKSQGMRPIVLSGYSDGVGRAFTTVWDASPGPKRHYYYGGGLDTLADHIQEARDRNYRIVDLSAYAPLTGADPASTDRSPMFTSIWEKNLDNHDWMVTGPVDPVRNQQDFDQYSKLGWRPLRTSGCYTAADGITYLTVWVRQDPGSFSAYFGLDINELATRMAGADEKVGQRPEQLGAFATDEEPASAGAFCPILLQHHADGIIPYLVQTFAHGYNEVPAVAVAIARDDQLVYSYGYGDVVQVEPHIPSSTPVTAETTLFRTASIAKTITSAAIMQLAEQAALTLDDRVFAPGGRLAGLAAGATDPRVAQITVRHLLQHAAGGWANDTNDPMYTHPTLNATDLVQSILAERSLDTDPGTSFAYSNFGYCILGRLIEAITGQTYGQHVTTTLLAKCGITRMQIADKNQAVDEVRYHGTGGQDPYAFPIHRMDSHGGWIASAVDLLRFAVRIDDSPAVPDILDTGSVTTMTTVPALANSQNYAAGWWIDPNDDTWFHTGNLPGSSTLLARTPDGFCLSFLTNTNTTAPDDPSTDTVSGLFRLMREIHDRVDFWPSGQPL